MNVFWIVRDLVFCDQVGEGVEVCLLQVCQVSCSKLQEIFYCLEHFIIPSPGSVVLVDKEHDSLSDGGNDNTRRSEIKCVSLEPSNCATESEFEYFLPAGIVERVDILDPFGTVLKFFLSKSVSVSVGQ